MMLTEQQAKAKLCHKTLAPVSMSHEFPIQTPANCVGSECMAWRFFEGVGFQARAEAEFRRTGRRLTPDEGFCGLVGAP
jgi:hypothetical protein